MKQKNREKYKITAVNNSDNSEGESKLRLSNFISFSLLLDQDVPSNLQLNFDDGICCCDAIINGTAYDTNIGCREEV